MSHKELTDDVQVAIKNESTEKMSSELPADFTNTSALSNPTQSSSFPLAVCCNPRIDFDTSDQLGKIVLSQLKAVQSDFTTYQQAMLTGLNTFSDSKSIQSIGTHSFNSLPRCVQFLISENFKKPSNKSFASTVRPDFNVADSTFVVEMGDRLQEVSFDCIKYPEKRKNQNQIVIANLFSHPDRSRFIHAIVMPFRATNMRTYKGASLVAHEYHIWPLPYTYPEFRIIRLREKEAKAVSSDETTAEDLDSGHQNSTRLPEVIRSIEAEHTRVDGPRFSKRNSPYVNYNVPKAFAGIFGTDSKRRRLTDVQHTPQSQSQTQASITDGTTVSTGHSSDNQVSGQAPQSAGGTCKSNAHSSIPNGFQHFLEQVIGSSHHLEDTISSVARSEGQPETATPRVPTASPSTTVDMDESATSIESLQTSASVTAQTSSLDTSTMTSPGSELPGSESMPDFRTTIRFINELKKIETPARLSECGTHDDLHDLAIIHKIATERTRLLRVEFDDPENYQILVNDQPEHFQTRFTDCVQALHAAYAHNPEKQFTIKIFNSDRVRR